MALAVAAWWVSQPAAEGRATDFTLPEVVELTAPAGFAVSAAKDNSETAFREDLAGFSAYHRIPESQAGSGQDNPPRLNIKGITKRLTTEPNPDEDDPSVGIRGKGYIQDVLDVGLNFGIVTLPMVAAVGVAVSPQDVAVYYDDEGWIVAYLTCVPAADGQGEATCEPAAAIWKHDTVDKQTTEEELGENLLALAINEVISAHNYDLPKAERLAKVSHDGDANGDNKVKYSDWQNPDCDAFVLFSTISSETNPVKFVIPHTIATGDIDASAAALITRQQAEEADTFATTLVDDEVAVTAMADEMRYAASFTLERVEGKTSLHSMSVSAPEGESAAGAVMLLYKRPS